MTQPIRWTCLLLGAVALALPFAAPAQEEKAPEVRLDSELAQQCYAAGLTIGNSIIEPGLELDLEAFIAGFRAAFQGADPAMTEEEAMTAFMALQQKLRDAAMQKANSANEEFLDEFAKKEGVKKTESGLLYKVVTEGDGPSPTANDTVQVHYKGTFVDGSEFDSSGDDPAQFVVSGVIPGWTEALQMMKVGGKWELAIPSHLAYGPRGRPGIPPNAVLLFDVELLSIVK